LCFAICADKFEDERIEGVDTKREFVPEGKRTGKWKVVWVVLKVSKARLT